MLLLILSAGTIQSVTIPAKFDYAKIEKGGVHSGPHHPAMPMPNIVPVDSSTGQFSM